MTLAFNLLKFDRMLLPGMVKPFYLSLYNWASYIITVTYLVAKSDAGKFHFDLERQLRVRVHNVLLDLAKSKQIKRIKLQGQYLYLSSDKAQSTKQIEQRDHLSMQARRIPAFISESIVIEILAEVIRQSKRHPRADQVASALAMRGLPIAEKDVMIVFDQYDIEKKTAGSHYFDT